jgi:hypothetical protein
MTPRGLLNGPTRCIRIRFFFHAHHQTLLSPYDHSRTIQEQSSLCLLIHFCM